MKHPKIDKQQLLSVYRRALLRNVSLDLVDQKVFDLSKRELANRKFEAQLDEKVQESFWQRIPSFVRFGAAAMPLLLIVIGIILAGSAAWPILSYFMPKVSFANSSLLSPVPLADLKQANDQGNLVFAKQSINQDEGQQGTESLSAASLDEPIMLDYDLDFTNLSNWFGEHLAELQDFDQQAEEYRLDIPSLNISNAMVRVGGTDLNKSLIQYPGTALPGQMGAPVIFGHSVLRQFYNPSEKNPRRYTSVFSKIMTMKTGEKIYLTYNNVKYTYEVQSNTEVQPTDIFILSQRLDARQLKLVTCVPEGTVLRRGVVIAQLVKE
jgi:LPXTG-site transpeptidase (sortase) family protein